MTRSLPSAGWLSAALLSAALLGACGEGEPASDDTAAPESLDPAIELGTGEDDFEPIADGEEINVVQGPQGGFHVYGSMRTQGIVPGDPDDLSAEDNPTVEFRVFHDGVQIDLGATYRQGLDPVDGEPGVYEMVGRLLILDIPNDDVLDGEEIRVEVELADVEGVVLTDERTLVAVPDPRNN